MYGGVARLSIGAFWAQALPEEDTPRILASEMQQTQIGPK
jgi:hypothetical protein